MVEIKSYLERIDDALIHNGFQRIDNASPDFDAIYIWLGRIGAIGFLVKDFTTSPADRQTIKNLCEKGRDWCAEKMLWEIPRAAGKWAKDGGFYCQVLLHQGQLMEESLDRQVDRLDLGNVKFVSIMAIDVTSGMIIHKKSWTLHGKTKKVVKSLLEFLSE